MAQVARRRFQQGQLILDGDRWIGRWREDVRGVDGQVRRVRRERILASTKDTTKRMARRLLEDCVRTVNSADYKPDWAGTFSIFADRWEKTVCPEHKPSTQTSEKSVLRAHLRPMWGDVRMREITTEALQTWIAAKRTTLAPKTIRNVIRTLSAMWTTAQAWSYVQHDPFRGLVLPAVPQGRVYYFSVEEAQQIIDRAPAKWKLFFRILAETGIRPGELAGLRRASCQPRSITITQSVWARKVQTVKSRDSARTFTISAGLGQAIQDFIATSPANEYDLLFVTEKWRAGSEKRLNQYEGGKPLSMDTFRQRILNPILEELGIRARVQALGLRCGNYAFRHLNATQMDTWGTPLKTRQKRLGHSDPSVTLRHYTEALDAEDLKVADRFGQLFN